ncbi:MAG: hypothetical protein ACLTDF_05715 [Coprococcus sp.]
MTDRAKKLNREEKLQLQAEKLKEQAQIDLEDTLCVVLHSGRPERIFMSRNGMTDLGKNMKKAKNRSAPYKCCSINAEGSESVKST